MVVLCSSQQIFRSYDSRVRPTTRSPEIYLSEDCKDIFGDATRILNLRVSTVDWSASDDNDNLWNVQKERSLQVIMTPYRPGTHVATKPTQFLSIIDQLEQLHKKGFVHGDIRAFNTVFDEENGRAGLIDFDFGGRLGRKYPNGYRKMLADGNRRCDINSSTIQKLYDSIALGRLMFEVYKLKPQEATQDKWPMRHGGMMHGIEMRGSLN